MKKLDARAWFTSMGFAPETAPRRPDPADMGTAFGLDASMTPTLPAPLDVEPGTADEPPAPAAGRRR